MRHRGQLWHSRVSLWLLTSSLAAGLMGQRPVQAADQLPAPPEPAVLRADAAGIILEWRGPDFLLSHVTGDDGRLYCAVEAPDWAQTGTPGQPQLPFTTALAVVPPTGDVTLHVQALEWTTRPLRYPVIPARAPLPVGDPPSHVEWEWARDERAYAETGSRPASTVALEELGWMRERRLVRLTFYPVRFDPNRDSLEVMNRVRIELRFGDQFFDGAQDEARGEARWGRDDPFIPLLQDAVVNPAQVTRFVRPARLASLPEAPADPSQVLDETAPTLTPGGPLGGADYLIIAHADFIDAVAPLAAHRATFDNLRVFSTTVQSIYEAYGSMDPAEAIKSYITYAYDNWTPPALEYVLLVGDGTRDSPSHSQQLGPSQNFVPPYVQTMDPPWCIRPQCDPWDAASDNRFVTLDGPDDQMADVLIGRLPVNTVAEATTAVGKILSYELNPPQWPWNERVLFFAGNESDAPYHRYSDAVFATLPITYTGRRVYFCTSDTSDCSEPHLYEDINTARDRTGHELNRGGLLASYVGHSSWHQWAVDPTTRAPMFHLDDVASLHNGGALPVILEMTCYTSDFSDPRWDTLDEVLLRQPGGGAVATWGPTTLGLSLGHNVLHQGFFDAVFWEGITELGQAIQAAKLDLVDRDNPYYLDLLDTFVLLGDPAMELNLDIVPWAHEVFLPATLRGP